MRILMCLIDVPGPTRNGFQVAVTGLYEQLRRHHDVRVLAYGARDGHAGHDGVRVVDRPSAGRRGGALGLVRSTVGRRPASVDALRRGMQPLVRQELDEFRPDVVHVSSGRLAMLVDELGRVPSVLAALDAWHLNVEARRSLAPGSLRLAYTLERHNVQRFEASRYPRFDAVTVVTPADRDALRQVHPTMDVTVIPNGVDPRFVAPVGAPARDPDLLVFTGVMDYAPNVAAARFLADQLLPRVRAVRPSARLALVGRNPSAEVRALGNRDGVEVTGEVPDVRPWLARGAVFVCPMQNGTGIKNKLLEAMASGAACVATPLATQGLGVRPGEHLLVATEAEELARQVLDVLDRPALATRLGEAARALVRANFAWETVARAYEDVYDRARMARSPGVGGRG